MGLVRVVSARRARESERRQVTPCRYYAAIGNRDYIKLGGQKRPFWEFLDCPPDGWLTSLAYVRRDLPDDGLPRILDCGAWSYRNEATPRLAGQALTPLSALACYLSIAKPGDFLVAPDHMLIGIDTERRRQWNRSAACEFIQLCGSPYRPMGVVHGETIADRVSEAEYLLSCGYRALAVGGVAARASQSTIAIAAVEAVRRVTEGAHLHVLGLSSPRYFRAWSERGVDSCDGSSHFKQAFTAGAFFARDGSRLVKWQAATKGAPPSAPACDCRACALLRVEGVDTRTYGSNEHNMGRAAHNLNQLIAAQKVAVSEPLDSRYQQMGLFA